MKISRRDVLQAASASLVLSCLPPILRAEATARRTFDPRPDGWRTFDVTTTVELKSAAGRTTVWIPVPSVNTDWQRSLDTTWKGNAQSAHRASLDAHASCVIAEFAPSESTPRIAVTSRVQTMNRATDWDMRKPGNESRASLEHWLRPTALAPTDGIVRKTAEQITAGTRTDFEKAQRIYEWILVSTYREPKVRGCGLGDIKTMLETGNLGGKCADLNGLFVGLCRAMGLPARDAYGLRLAPSAFGYRELGSNSASLKGAQHCRAEVYLRQHGWVAMDPADVDKVMRQETDTWIRNVGDPLVTPVRRALFGGWEGNWMAYNMSADVSLPGAKGGPLPFLMYPQAENAAGRYDSLDADNFKYTIEAREVVT